MDRKIRPADTETIPPVDVPFAGRSQWIDTVFDACARSPLVVLDGEPGVGKSALLESGLIPRLTDRGTFLPVYVRAFPGTDWISGPATTVASALLGALERELSEDDVLLQAIRESSGPADILQLLHVVQKYLGKTPCLLLDQLDDYVRRHTDQFTVAHGALKPAALKPSELIARNPFWATIESLLRTHAVTCVLATRTRQPLGFSAFNLVSESDVTRLTLEPLGAAETDEILSAMAPDGGSTDWVELKNAIIKDLNPDQERASVLPIQLETVLRGLTTLRITRAKAYRKLGHERVERAYLARRIQAAARKADLGHRPWIVYEMLGHLVGGGGSVPVPETLLAERCPGALRGQLHLALEDLSIWHITRESESGWQLYHDYLCDPVLALVRAEHTLEQDLTIAHHAWKKARGPIERWRSLVPPLVQLRMMQAHLRGRLAYGPTGLVSASLARLAINGVVMTGLALALAAGALATRELDAQTAGIINVFDTDRALHPAEAEALARFERAFWPVQDQVLSAFAEPRNRAVFEAHQRFFAQRVAALAPGRQEGLRRAVNTRCAWVEVSDAAGLRACGLLWAAVATAGPRRQTVALLLDGNFSLKPELVNVLPPRERLPTLESALSLFEASPDRPPYVGLCVLLRAIELPSDRTAVRQLLHLGDRDVVEYLRRKNLLELLSSSCLPERLDVGDLSDAAETLSTEIGEAKTPAAAQDRVRELVALPGDASHDAYAERAAAQLLDKASAASGVAERIGYLNALVVLNGLITGSMSDRIVTLVLSSVPAASRPEEITPAGDIVNKLEMPSPRLVRALVQALVAKAVAQRDPLLAIGYASTAGNFSRLLGPNARCDLVRKVFARIGPDSSPDAVHAMAGVAQRFGAECLSPDERLVVQRSILRSALDGTGSGRFDRLEELQFWSAFLAPAEAQKLTDDLLAALRNRSVERGRVIDAMLALPKLEYTADVRSIVDELINTPENSDRLERFLTVFRDALPSDTRRHLEKGLVDQLLEAGRRDAAALALLAAPWHDDSQFVWNELFPAWLRRPGSALSAGWGSLLTGLGGSLPEEQADAALQEVVRVGRRAVPRECAVAASLVRPLTASVIRDEVLSWPTCDELEQRDLRQRMSQHGVLISR